MRRNEHILINAPNPGELLVHFVPNVFDFVHPVLSLESKRYSEVDKGGQEFPHIFI